MTSWVVVCASVPRYVRMRFPRKTLSKICGQELYWGVLLGIIPVREEGSRLDNGSSAVMQWHESSLLIPEGALEL